MRSILFASILLVMTPAWVHSQPFIVYNPASRGITIQFYKNIEFLGFAFFLGSQYMGELYEHDETLNSAGVKKKDWFAWDLSLYKQYKSFKGNKDLAVATGYAEALEGSDLMRLMIRLSEFPNAAITNEMDASVYIMFSEKRDSAEARKNASIFIESLNKFYKETAFDSYFSQNDHFYEQALKEIRSVLPSNKFLPAIEKFYHKRFYSYSLIPSLTIPSGMAWGASDKKDGKTRIFNSFGPFALQQFSIPPYNLGFADEKHIRELSVHEFGHSFVNPVLNKMPKQWIDETAALFDTVKTAMENQGYNNWMSCLYEHFVRAGEVIISKNLGYAKNAENLRDHYINDRKFIYLPIIIKELELYNKNERISYEDVVKRVIEQFYKKIKRV